MTDPDAYDRARDDADLERVDGPDERDRLFRARWWGEPTRGDGAGSATEK